MLGSTPETNELVNDVIGELTNMIAGGLKSAYCDAGYPCSISIPTIIRGKSFTVGNPPHTTREMFLYQSGPNTFAVELHIRFQTPS